MKILTGFILGLLFASALWYCLPHVHRYFPDLPVPNLQKPSTYSHQPEGKVLQSLDNITGDEFRSTEGNGAVLYQLKGKCKLTLNIFGESYKEEISFYLHQGKILSAFETSYSYPNGGFYAEAKTEEAFETQQHYLKIMNPVNRRTMTLFEEIASQFKPKFIKVC